MVVFQANLDYNSPIRHLQHTPSDGSKYIGKPSPEVDAALAEIASSRLACLHYKYYANEAQSSGGVFDAQGSKGSWRSRFEFRRGCWTVRS